MQMDRSGRRGYLEGGDGTRVGSITQPNIFGKEKDENYEKYENPKVFGSYQAFLLALDFLFNLAVDCAYKEPLVILVCFLLQSLVLIINLILYIMSSANQAMQTGLKQRTVRHHEANIVTSITYMILTAWWYIWAMRRAWPSVSDQFSFSFSGPDSNTQNDATTKPLTPVSNLTQNQNGTLGKGGSDEQRIKETGFPQLSVTDSEIFTLWSPGFLALYSIQRTVAVIHYIVYLKSTFIVLNSPFLDKYEEQKASLSTETVISHVNPSFQNDKDGDVINEDNAISSDSIENSEEDELEDSKEHRGRREGRKKATGSSKPSIARKTNPKAKIESTSYSAGGRRPKSERNSPRSQRDGADAHSPNAHNMPNKKTHKNSSSNKSKRLTNKNRSQSEDFYEEMSEDTTTRY